jgi:hypothetical protein
LPCPSTATSRPVGVGSTAACAATEDPWSHCGDRVDCGDYVDGDDQLDGYDYDDGDDFDDVDGGVLERASAGGGLFCASAGGFVVVVAVGFGVCGPGA